MFVERKGKIFTWTWDQYYKDAMKFAKALAKLKVIERTAVGIMGFNSPEWGIAFIGAMMYNCVNTGIYITNAAEACVYQADHSEAEVIIVETNEMLSRFSANLDKLPKVKAIIVYGEASLPTDMNSDVGKKIILWRDFMNLGNSVGDEVIFEKMNRQNSGECCCLIYTSGTTGNPKGCMLSHDNLVWETVGVMEVTAKEKPDMVGPQNRIVSYLPLSHIAGLSFDILSHYFNGSELYFAKPDAL